MASTGHTNQWTLTVSPALDFLEKSASKCLPPDLSPEPFGVGRSKCQPLLLLAHHSLMCGLPFEMRYAICDAKISEISNLVQVCIDPENKSN